MTRYGAATPHLATVERLLLQRTGLPSMAPGTLNVQLSERYVVTPDATISGQEYFTGETIKLQRCRVRGHRMIIMRPHTHELLHPGPKDPARVTELVSPLKLRDAWALRTTTFSKSKSKVTSNGGKHRSRPPNNA